jgi:hypothetical protein
VTITSTPGINFEPAIARGSEGNLYCGWESTPSDTVTLPVSLSTDGGNTWSAPVDILSFQTPPVPSGTIAEGLKLVSDPLGRLHALWIDNRLGVGNLYYSFSDDYASTWHQAEKVNDNASGLFESRTSFDATLDSAGTLCVLWADDRNKYGPPTTGRDIFFDSHPEFGSFGADIQVSPPILEAEQDYPTIEAGAGTTLHAAWVDDRDAQSINPPFTNEIFYARSEDTGASWTFETKVPFDSPGYDNFADLVPEIQVSPWGNPYIVYQRDRERFDVSRSCDQGDTWQTPFTIYTVPTDSFFTNEMSFKMVPDGRLHLLYYDSRLHPGPSPEFYNLWLTRSE